MDIRKTFSKEEFRNVAYDVPLKGLTTFKIGGPAAVVVQPCDAAEVQKALKTAKENGVEWFVLGNGSNVLALDGGFHGVVLRLGHYFAQVSQRDEIISADAGASVKSVSELCYRSALTGAEFLSTLPASVGGAVVMNAGCFGCQMSDVVSAVWATDGTTERMFRKEECRFGYRDSVFQHNGFVVTHAELRFQKGNREQIRLRSDEMAYRKRKTQPLEKYSAGSVFKQAEGQCVSRRIAEMGVKGMRIGDAEVSTKHAGFIVNRFHASGEDVLLLMDLIRQKYKRTYGVELQPEIRVLGDTYDLGRLSYAHAVQPRQGDDSR